MCYPQIRGVRQLLSLTLICCRWSSMTTLEVLSSQTNALTYLGHAKTDTFHPGALSQSQFPTTIMCHWL